MKFLRVGGVLQNEHGAPVGHGHPPRTVGAPGAKARHREMRPVHPLEAPGRFRGQQNAQHARSVHQQDAGLPVKDLHALNGPGRRGTGRFVQQFADPPGQQFARRQVALFQPRLGEGFPGAPFHFAAPKSEHVLQFEIDRGGPLGDPQRLPRDFQNRGTRNKSAAFQPDQPLARRRIHQSAAASGVPADRQGHGESGGRRNVPVLPSILQPSRQADPRGGFPDRLGVAPVGIGQQGRGAAPVPGPAGAEGLQRKRPGAVGVGFRQVKERRPKVVSGKTDPMNPRPETRQSEGKGPPPDARFEERHSRALPGARRRLLRQMNLVGLGLTGRPAPRPPTVRRCGSARIGGDVQQHAQFIGDRGPKGTQKDAARQGHTVGDVAQPPMGRDQGRRGRHDQGQRRRPSALRIRGRPDDRSGRIGPGTAKANIPAIALGPAPVAERGRQHGPRPTSLHVIGPVRVFGQREFLGVDREIPSMIPHGFE